MSEQSTQRLPLVHGGILLECVGGPLDGELVFLRGGESTLDLGHFFDAPRTPWLHGARPGAANYLGYYSPREFTNGAPADWHPFHNALADKLRAPTPEQEPSDG